MDWIDEPGGEELWQEWEWLFEDVSSTVEALDSQFGGNETEGVMSLASTLIVEVTALHAAAGMLFLPAEPVIDIANDLDLAARLTVEAALDDEDRDMDDDEQRDIGVVFEAVTEGATKVCDLVDRAKCTVAGEVEDSGSTSQNSLLVLADSAALLVEWARIYVETAVGYHHVTGRLPDTFFGGSGLAEMHDWERSQELQAGLAPSSLR